MYHQLIGLSVTCILSVANAATDPNYRLNTPIVPSAYHLLVAPYFDTNDEKAFTFDGEVTIEFTTTAITNYIKLHSEDLNFVAANITVTNLNSKAIVELSRISPLMFNEYYSFAYISLQRELIPNIPYAVKIVYTGPLRKDLSGFYRTFYLDNGVKKWLAATQLEASHARKVFPCLDEPGLKATFTIQIDRPSSYKNSLSNMRMKSSVDLGNGYIRESFYPTPIMPTYLVALLVSEYELSESTNGSQEFRIYTRPSAKDQTSYAFDFGPKVLEELGNYLDYDYYSANENLKLDHVSIPDFRTGAMENWGLVKYKESLLLYDPAQSGPFYRYRVAQNLAHESAHFWFGNLVTCHWWSDTWLNEGFASYFHDYITAFIEPELGSNNLMVVNTIYTAYDTDDTPASVPLTNEDVNSPAEINNQFARISYQKGCAIIRMIHHLLEDDAFKLGLQTYLKNSAFGSGFPHLLYAGFDHGASTYNSLNLYPNETIADVMGSWVTLPGHPVLYVSVDYATHTVTLTQKRFYGDRLHSSKEIYKIPITYTSGVSPDFHDTKPTFIMNTKTHKLTIDKIGELHTWVIFNVQETGYYKVNYDRHSWQVIALALRGSERNTIHHLNRAKLVNDLFALLYADEVEFSVLYDVLKFLVHEDEYSVWVAALKGFNKLRNSYMGHADTLRVIDLYILTFTSAYIDRFGYEERETDSFEDERNRQQILEFACTLRYSKCIVNALTKFKALKEDGVEVNRSLRPVVYRNGLRWGINNTEDYDFLWNRLTTTTIASEVPVIIEALGHTSNIRKLRSYLLSMTVENSPVRTQDLNTPLTSVLNHYDNLDIVMVLLQRDYALWNSIYTSMDTVLSSIASNLRTIWDFIKVSEYHVPFGQRNPDINAIIYVIANAPNVRVIELDAKELTINHIKVLDGNRNIISGSRPLEYNNVRGKLYIYLNEPLKVYHDINKQFYFIQISYRKEVKEDSNGIFLVKYYDEQDKDYKYLFTTRLSPYEAKYFFPCFHNPRFEAVFKFKVFVPQKMKNLQNTNTTICIAEEQRRSHTNDYLILDYMPSPQVCLHQVGFHHSRFASKEAFAIKSNDTFILWAPIDEIDDFKFIFKYGITIINLIQEYSKTKRNLVEGPINLVAAPKIITGYEIGSWNLLTNGAHRITKIDQFTSIKQIETMIFELAQQLCRIWLGNPGELQRTRWREEWFKEGMATYLAYYFVTQYNHGIQPIHQRPLGAYGLQMKHKAMAADWHKSTPALGTYNSSLAIEIPSEYKELVQMKTGAILWMLESWVESEKFHQSLVNFINTRRGKYISLQEFTTVLDRDNIECMHQFFNGSTASRILYTWLRRPGYPVINVQVLRDRTPNAIQLKQRQFSFTRENRIDTDFLIPISYIVQNNQNCFNCYRPRFTIGAQTYTFGENLNNGWILLNRQSSGYYRVNYDAYTWKLIAKTLKENMSSIDELNRAQIVNDVLVLYVAGDIDVQLAMEILDYLHNERSPVVWESVLDGFEKFIIEGASFNMNKYLFWEWEEFLTKKVSKIFGQLAKSKDQEFLIRLFKSNVIELACLLNYQPCHAHIGKMYLEERRGKHNFFPDCRMSYFYMLANETYRNTYSRGYNAIEQEDKYTAEDKIRDRNRFINRLPLGGPSPMPIMMSTTEKSIEPIKTTDPEKVTGNGASTFTFSFIIFLISVINFIS